MQNKEAKLIIKIIGLIGAIFCLIAIFVPWAEGVHTFGAGYADVWSIFYVDFFTADMPGEFIFFGMAMIIIFILTIIATVLGFLGFKDFETKGTKKYLTSAIFATISFIIYVIAVSLITSYISGFGFGVPTFAGYGIGFVMILIAMIMFYITFFIGKVMSITPAPAMQQPMYQQPTYQQPAYQQQTYQPPPTQPTPPPPPEPVQQPETPPPQPAPKEKKQPQTSVNFCPSCGKKVIPNTKFCAHCGKQIM
jgi:hypothetical protein